MISNEFQHFDWTSLDRLNPDDGAEYLTSTILEICSRHIPTKTITERCSKHPWMNDRCKEAVGRKLQSSTREQFRAAATSCSQIILEEYHKYIRTTRDKLRNLRRGSKQWWRLSQNLMNKSSLHSGIPALRKDDGSWCRDPQSKANLLVSTFSSKFHLPPVEFN